MRLTIQQIAISAGVAGLGGFLYWLGSGVKIIMAKLEQVLADLESANSKITAQTARLVKIDGEIKDLKALVESRDDIPDEVAARIAALNVAIEAQGEAIKTADEENADKDPAPAAEPTPVVPAAE